MRLPTALLTGLAVVALSACVEQPNSPRAKSASCSPVGYDSATLLKLKADKFDIAEHTARQDLALALADCLSDPNPKIRDGVAYEALSIWMRGGKLERSTIIALKQSLLAKVRGANDDTDGGGYGRPFAALVLSEVARVDRIEPFMSAGERSEFVSAATTFMDNISDYRGYNDKQGWRHNVAHGSDWLMQLTLNESVTGSDLVSIRNAVAKQVRADGEHAYIHGEPDRLARPILFLARRGTFSELEWTSWIEALANPSPLSSWNDAFSSEHGLAKRHNVKAFLKSLYLNASLSDDPNIRALLPGVTDALRKLP